MSHVSDPFNVSQGVCQGGILSTLHYKLFNNVLLHMLESLQIGCIKYCDLTCADDVPCLAFDGIT